MGVFYRYYQVFACVLIYLKKCIAENTRRNFDGLANVKQEASCY
jgi:hypothetical protein